MQLRNFWIGVLGVVTIVATVWIFFSLFAERDLRPPDKAIDFAAVWTKFCEASPIEITVYWWAIEGIKDDGHLNRWKLDAEQTIALLGYVTGIVDNYSINRGILLCEEKPVSDIPPPQVAPEGVIEIKNSHGASCEISYYSASILEDDLSFGMVITDHDTESGFTIPCSREFIEDIYNELKKIKEKKQ